MGKRKKLVLMICVLLGLGILAMAYLWYWAPVIRPEYGVVPLEISPNKVIYVKRVVTGLAVGRDTLAISASTDPCTAPDPSSDYIYPDSGHQFLFYKIENGTLFLYDSGEARTPENGQFPVKVVQNVLTTLEYIRLREDPAALGVKKLEVPIDKSIKCR
jgi:hypothetical protein